MSVLPDPAELEAIAARIAGHALVTRARAHHLGLGAAGVGWQGVAARTFELTAQDTVQSLRLAADRLDDAAAALRRHADAVRQVLDALRRLAGDSGALLSEFEQGLRDEILAPTRLLGDGVGLLGATDRLLGDAGRLVGIG